MFIRKIDAGTGHINLSQLGYTVVQGTWTYNNSSTFTFFTELVNGSGPATGDAITVQVYLAAGTYKAYGMHLSGANRGTIKLSIYSSVMSAITIYTADLYATVADPSNSVTSSTFTIPESRFYTIKFEITGKNASSTNYFGGYQKMTLVRQS